MFPFKEYVEIAKNISAHQQDVLKYVWPLLTPERQAKIQKVVSQRNFKMATVLENIYDRGNASAVMRSAEAFGFPLVHMIETGDKFKESSRVTAGADKWMEVQKWSSTSACVTSLKRQGFRILVTHLDAKAVDIRTIPANQPLALVLGNEKEGVSAEMLALADQTVIVPMAGFVQSFNISVAGALCLSILRDSFAKQGALDGYLSATEQEVLKAVYALRTLDSAFEVLLDKNNKQELIHPLKRD